MSKNSPILEKSFNFSLVIISLYQKLQNEKEFVISKQLLRCGTSIGANIEEASAGQSRRDFLSKMSIASKESRETRYWLRLLDKSNLTSIDVSNEIELADELIRILTSIVKTTAQSLEKENNK